MFQLLKKEYIRNNIFAIYMQPEVGGTTHIKFGGWDKIGIAPNEELKMVKTFSNMDWDVNFDQMKINGREVKLQDPSNKAYFDPGYPYIYVPF